MARGLLIGLKMKSNLNFINGDENLNFLQKIFYTFFFFTEFIVEKKQKSNFLFDFDERDLNNFYNNKEKNLKNYNSPARLCCDAYLLSFLKKNFNNHKKIKILDIGCGKGVYLSYFKNFFKDKEIEYIGLDKFKNDNWKKIVKKNSQFYKINFNNNNVIFLEDLKEKYGDFDLIFSTSVLEHVEHDLSLLKDISQVFNRSINLHFVPSSISFMNYRRHGIRRYTEKTLNLLRKYISSEVSLFPLGNHLTMKYYYIFYEKFKNKKHPFEKYVNMKDVKNTNIKDILFSKKGEYAIFYAIKF